jgi:hypothetical protein
MGGLNLVRPSQCHHQAVQASDETLDIEIQRIVVAVGDLCVDRGVERGNQPLFGPYARDDINEREPIVLGGCESGIGRSRVITTTVTAATSRLDARVDDRCLTTFSQRSQ